LFLVLDNLSPSATLLNAAGATAVLTPLGSPYVSVNLHGEGDRHGHGLQPHESATVLLEFNDPSGADISFDTRVLSVTPAP
jgi:hypothetical protein